MYATWLIERNQLRVYIVTKLILVDASGPQPAVDQRGGLKKLKRERDGTQKNGGAPSGLRSYLVGILNWTNRSNVNGFPLCPIPSPPPQSIARLEASGIPKHPPALTLARLRRCEYANTREICLHTVRETLVSRACNAELERKSQAEITMNVGPEPNRERDQDQNKELERDRTRERGVEMRIYIEFGSGNEMKLISFRVVIVLELPPPAPGTVEKGISVNLNGESFGRLGVFCGDEHVTLHTSSPARATTRSLTAAAASARSTAELRAGAHLKRFKGEVSEHVSSLSRARSGGPPRLRSLILICAVDARARPHHKFSIQRNPYKLRCLLKLSLRPETRSLTINDLPRKNKTRGMIAGDEQWPAARSLRPQRLI
ncbi:hypothetical protein EVAR_38174_1 [Eumeta japonica]|uniref:Uncharacterized protein n=1 Tax=Eumeta variegata TaxID=151549 RepID=A0A4C1WDD2_EUMVA|nr:hypothetical protein EVAR_38174_1 [Eumeta japonica]